MFCPDILYAQSVAILVDLTIELYVVFRSWQVLGMRAGCSYTTLAGL